MWEDFKKYEILICKVTDYRLDIWCSVTGRSRHFSLPMFTLVLGPTSLLSSGYGNAFLRDKPAGV